jgi:hypothetical protein
LFGELIFYTRGVVYIGKQRTMEMFVIVLTAILVSNLGNFPIAALRRYFAEEARHVPEIGALEPFWGSIGTAATASFFYVVEKPDLPLVQVVIVVVALTLPTAVAGLPTYYAARRSWAGVAKASLPVLVGLPLLVVVQTVVYRLTGLSSSVVTALAGVGFTLVLVAGWGTAIRKGLLRSTTRDWVGERVASLEQTLEQERVLITQLTSTVATARDVRRQQLAELRDAEGRLAELEGVIANLEERNAQGSRDLEQARLELDQLTGVLRTAHTVRDEQIAEASGLRDRVLALEAENARLRTQLEQGDSEEAS